MSISRLCLGTAKWLPNYGVGSVSHPTDADKEAILRRAVALGVGWFDTGAAYADAEDWLRLMVGGARCVTKLSPALIRLADNRNILAWDILLLHNPTIADLKDPDLLDWLKISLRRAWGASVYTPEEAYAAMHAGLSILQVPYCLLDRRHEQVIVDAKARGVTVFARQPFLQGCLLNYEPASYAASVGAYAACAIATLRDIAARHELNMLEAALWYTLDSPADYVVFGVGSVAHLEEVCTAASRPRPAQWSACKAAILAAIEHVPPVVFQSVWRKA